MIECVLFDLDGTIVNTNELIINSFMYTLEQHALPALTREQMIPYMGTSLPAQLRSFTNLEDVSPLEASYRRYQTEHHDELIKSFPNVNETLEVLRGRGIKLGVVTTKIRPNTIRALEMFDLKQYMDTVVTLDDVEKIKPHAEPVLTAVGNLGVSPEKTLMVGDSPVDIQSGKNAGVLTAAVAWSLKGEEMLGQYEPDFILQDMTDLYDIVGGSGTSL
ncbi:pyrophosphatase PpaX [Paenibacillus sp. HN-1]|uniref:pyrophosphatase PpaX n=1 Tax=Paenibacillus TaxID=44249 RepID=UPI001CA7DAE4|nr:MULTISPECIES: pyrophosphatase PpaX [Paenibacillus]MBY9078980.1 pyrophosphatase PpaX [Paenibacillus sp. CGMCC 1.18879]MBY9084342.1 pyrophosphatase PpaX [Paenibacillus sinensis]